MEDRTTLNRQLAQMLKGGVIMDVTTPEQARIAEAAGACAVMALERIPADIRAAGGVSRMSDPKMIKGIQQAVTIPVMAKCRIGHFAEAQILEAIEIDYIDESEVLSPADDIYHIDKRKFRVPFVCGAKDLGEALRRINEGATMIRTKGEPGTGDIIQAVRHMRMMQSEIRRLVGMAEDELYEAAKQLRVPFDLVQFVHENGKLPVVNFAAGGVATPADAALMMQLGAEGVFVGSGIFKSGNPEKRAQAIVKAHRQGTCVLGICGGYQMMGMEVCDPRHLEGSIERMPGLGLLPVTTVMGGEKTTRQTRCRLAAAPDGPWLEGYEIHMGETRPWDNAVCAPLTVDASGREEGCLVDEKCMGTYIHGILDNTSFIDTLLAPFSDKIAEASRPFDYQAFKDQQYDLLADHVRRHVDMDLIYQILQRHD